MNLQLFAHPWWVNLLLLIPLLAWIPLKKAETLPVRRQLAFLALFAIAFGFVEAAVVVYLRAAVGLLPGYHGTLADVRLAAPEFHKQAVVLQNIPPSLLQIEVLREAATMIMLAGIALVSGRQWGERWTAFLWTFAIWDASYYGALWATVHWPASLTDLDILFLIPAPWIAQIWFPLLVSGRTIAGIMIRSARTPS